MIEYADPAARFRAGAGGKRGAGTDSRIRHDPDCTEIGDGTEPWMSRPADVGLAHALARAAAAANGAVDPGSATQDGRVTRNRDAQAIGLGSYASGPALEGTENAYRAERGLPPRTRF